MEPADQDERAGKKTLGKLSNLLDKLPSEETFILFSLRCLAVAQICYLLQILLQRSSSTPH